VLERSSGDATDGQSYDLDVTSAYSILGIEPGSAPEDVRRAYLDRIREWHPDRHPNDPRKRQAGDLVSRRINEAYHILYKNHSRTRYRVERKNRPYYIEEDTSSQDHEISVVARISMIFMLILCCVMISTITLWSMLIF